MYASIYKQIMRLDKRIYRLMNEQIAMQLRKKCFRGGDRAGTAGLVYSRNR